MNGTSLDTIDIELNSAASTDSLWLISKSVSSSILILYIILGLFGNILNILLFTSPALFRTSCSWYLLSTSIVNLLVTVFVIPLRLSADGFDQDITSYSLLSCQLVSYLYYLCLALPPFFTVFACLDRWAASCVQVNRRRFARIHVAKRLIPLIVIFCCVLYSHIFMTFTVDPKPPPPYCSVADTYAVFGVSFQLIVYSLIPPFLMALFSIGIIFNAIRKGNRVLPAVQMINTSVPGRVVRQNDRRRLSQMQVMLVCQAITECILTLPFSLINLISIMMNNDDTFLVIYSFIRLFIFINYVISFYVYTLSSKLYRDELRKLIRRIYHHR